MATPSKARRRVAPIVWALVLCTIFGAVIAFVVWIAVQTPIPLFFVILYAGAYAGAIVGLLIALIQRLKEIDGGEEDEAVQY